MNDYPGDTTIITMREVEAITIMVVGGGAGEDIVWRHLPIILSFEYRI